jgi:tetratricopeptide (TPR) repeat protein
MTTVFAFVLMPFKDEFDDVYSVIKQCCSSSRVGHSILCQRADEIAEPGRITDQIIEAIKRADFVVADLTGNNPNVMYELGYAQALGKPTILLNQAVDKTPFDTKDLRQIVYDRTRLVKDCAPRLVTAIDAVVRDGSLLETSEQSSPAVHVEGEAGDSPVVESDQLEIGMGLLNSVMLLALELDVAASRADVKSAERVGRDVVALLDRVSVTDYADPEMTRNVILAVGNCAVSLAHAECPRVAEDLFKRAIGLSGAVAGVRLQYAVFLATRNRLTEAQNEFNEARRLEPDEPRLDTVQTQLAVLGGKADPSLAGHLKATFEADPSNRRNAVAYLGVIQRARCSKEEFEGACRLWMKHANGRDLETARRILGDFYAERNFDQQARLSYEELLAATECDDRADVLHNLAQICVRLDDSQSAEGHWREAYRLKAHDPAIRQVFGNFLRIRQRYEDARKVMKGEPI